MKDNEKTEHTCSGIQCAVSGCFLRVNENFVSGCWPRTTLRALGRKRRGRVLKGTFAL